MREGGTARLLRLPGPEPGPWKDGQVLLQRAAVSFTAGELTALLEHGNPAVRRRARDRLVARGFHEAQEPLSRTARRAPAVPARLNALRGLAALAARHPVLLNEMQLLFTPTEPAVRTLAVRLAGNWIISGRFRMCCIFCATPRRQSGWRPPWLRDDCVRLVPKSSCWMLRLSAAKAIYFGVRPSCGR